MPSPQKLPHRSGNCVIFIASNMSAASPANSFVVAISDAVTGQPTPLLRELGCRNPHITKERSSQ